MPTSGTTVLAVVIGLAAGFLLGAQPSVNGTLGQNLRNPLQASLISFTVGTAALLIMTVATNNFPPNFTTKPSELPWWVWIGGLIGVVMVTTSLMLVPRVGSLMWFACVMTGQTVAAICLDHFGLLGNQKQSISLLRLTGAGLLIAGVLTIVYAKHSERKLPDSIDKPPIASDETNSG